MTSYMLQMVILVVCSLSVSYRHCEALFWYHGLFEVMARTLVAKQIAEGDVGAVAVALAYRAQMVESVPMCDYDRPVDIIVTADSILSCSDHGKQVHPNG